VARPWAPVARSPIPPPPPVAVRDGWEVSARESHAPLRLVDCTPLAKVLVRADPSGPLASRLGVPPGRAARDRHGTLVVGAGPEEWLLLGPVGAETTLAARVRELAAAAAGGGDHPGVVSVVEPFSHGRALLRLVGTDAPRLLAKVCAVDLGAVPDGTALRTAVARLATDVVRDDLGATPSYLLHCERSSGRYLRQALLDAGREFGIEPDGFAGKEW
jgi:heterotetrameric sarcosine oxidase gamma subunit